METATIFATAGNGPLISADPLAGMIVGGSLGLLLWFCIAAAIGMLLHRLQRSWPLPARRAAVELEIDAQFDNAA